jgi:hypothetical protein
VVVAAEPLVAQQLGQILALVSVVDVVVEPQVTTQLTTLVALEPQIKVMLARLQPLVQLIMLALVVAGREQSARQT